MEQYKIAMDNPSCVKTPYTKRQAKSESTSHFQHISSKRIKLQPDFVAAIQDHITVIKTIWITLKLNQWTKISN